jgi:mannosyltransferase OCH1-like enzyme
MPVTIRDYRPLKVPNTLNNNKHQPDGDSPSPLMIPKIIHQTWKHSELPIQYRHFRRSWRQRNPSYQHRFYDDSECLRTVETYFPEYVSLYTSISLPIQRADIFRYLVMYQFGGFYADIDTTCLRPLESLRRKRPRPTLILGRDYIRTGRHRGRMEYLQWFLASTPGHPVWKFVLEVIRERFQLLPAKLFPKTQSELGDVYTLWLTGPQAFTAGVNRYFQQYSRQGVLEVNSALLGSMGGRHRQTNPYLIHHYQGSWKNNWKNRRHRRPNRTRKASSQVNYTVRILSNTVANIALQNAIANLV